MTTLRLFEAEIAVDTAITTVQPVPGFSVTTQLVNSNTSIRIKLDGALGAARFNGFTTTPRCLLLGNEVRLAAGSTVPNAGQVSIDVFGVPSPFSSPGTVIADPASRVGFKLQSNFALKQFLNIDFGALAGLANINQPDSWTSSQLLLSIPRKQASLDINAGGPSLTVTDGFGDGPESEFARQWARLVRMRLDTAAVFPVYRFELNGGFHLHADVLDPTADIDQVNGMLFQHVISEAHVVAQVELRNNTPKAVSWMVEPQEPDGAFVLAVSSMKDEHGHPLMIECKASVPLAGRAGTAVPSADGRTNSAVVLGRPDQETKIVVKVVAADPVTLYDRSRAPKDLDAGNNVQRPYWISADGTVPRRASHPREILGLSANLTLAIGKDQARSPLDAQLVLSPLLDQSLGLRFVTSHLEFASSGSMAMMIDTAETAIQASQNKAGDLQRRRAPGIDNRTIRLPLLNANWAFADLSGPKQNGDDRIAARGRTWMESVDASLHHPTTGAFQLAEIPDYTHVEGLRAQPVPQPFTRVTPPPIVTTMAGERRDAAAVGLKSSRLAFRDGSGVAVLPHLVAARVPTFAAIAAVGPAVVVPKATTDFLFGGTNGFPKAGDANDVARQFVGPAAEKFFQFWAGVLPPPTGAAPERWAAARRALRQYLVGTQDPLPDPDDWGLDDLIEASARLSSARALISTNPPAALGFDDWADSLDDVFPEDVPELLDPDNGDGVLELIFQFAFAPPSMALFRRAADLILRNPQFAYADILRDLVFGVDSLIQGIPTLNGLLAELLQGTNAPFAAIEAIWTASRTALDRELADLLDGLVSHYGPTFDMHVFHAILDSAADSETLLEIVQILGLPLRNLADLAGDPPDYLLVTRRFRRPGSSGPSDEASSLNPIDKAAVLWGRRFDFCKLGAGHFWDFVLDDQATMIVKLGGSRGLDSILQEIHAGAVAPGRPDPLGLTTQAEDAKTALDNFIALLPPELKAADWRGMLVINPTIDLGRDPMLRTLCGFSTIGARFAAVGGRAPTGDAVQLDVWGRIEKHADPSGWVDQGGAKADVPGWSQCDVGWSLTKFEATIKNTSIVSGEIAFRLEIRELFGKTITIPPITVAGTLPPAAGNAGAPRDFSFSATFDRPEVIDIDVKFIKALQLRGIKVGSFHNDTVLNIDADLICQEADFGFFKFEPSADPVKLSDVRIGIPELPPGRALVMGIQRYLSIDLGAISFPLPPDKQLQVAGLEIKPAAIGMMRDTQSGIIGKLNRETIRLKSPGFPAAPGDPKYAYPYLDTQIEFGSKPSIGGGGRLALVARVGVPVGPSGLGSPGVGLASLTGKELKISLFHLLTLEAETVDARVAKVVDPDTPSRELGSAGTILVDKFNLKLGNWSLFKDEDVRTLILAHDVNSNRKGALGFFAHAPGAGFFKLHWLLLAKGFDPGRDLKNKLLESRNDDLDAERDLILGILSGPNNQTPVLRARIDDSAWLFGVKFELGPLFTPCVLVLQDGGYYGIRLGGPLAKLLTGEDDISFAYIPGAEPSLDRFRTTFRVAALDSIASMRSGEIALEWSPNWDFLIDLGQPWRGPGGYAWDRAFSIPVGVYEAKFGFFVEKRTAVTPPPNVPATGGQFVTFSAGAGFYLGYGFEWVAGPAWVRAGIGIFGVMIGSATLQLAAGASSNPLALLKGTLVQLQVTGVIGIYAYGEGGVEIWIISARFRVSAQAFLEVTLTYIPHGRSQLAYSAMLAAAYSASVRIGSGWFSWTFSVSGSVQMEIKGQVSFG